MTTNNPSQNFSMEQAIAFASRPEGQQLIELLRKQNQTDLAKAQAYAAAGDWEQAKIALGSLLTDPQVQKLMKQFGG